MNHPPLPLPFAQALLDFEVQVTDKEPLKGASLLSLPVPLHQASARLLVLEGKGFKGKERHRASEQASERVETNANTRLKRKETNAKVVVSLDHLSRSVRRQYVALHLPLTPRTTPLVLKENE